jgi:TatD DNase family protein
MRLIDTHCHLTHNRLGPIASDALARARQAGVVATVCASADLDESAASRAMAEANADVWFMAGIHPHDAAAAPSDFGQRLKELCSHQRCVAVGEIGLDYHYDYSPRAVQRDLFACQLGLAAEIDKPVVVHTREAFDDTLAILQDSGADLSRVVLHSCTEGPENLHRALALGVWVSFSGIVTFNKATELHASAVIVPDDRLMIETDAPFLSPEPVRNMKTNEPANVQHVLRKLAQLRGVAPEALAERTAENAARFFTFAPPSQ